MGVFHPGRAGNGCMTAGGKLKEREYPFNGSSSKYLYKNQKKGLLRQPIQGEN
jgi:hypothetical protein